MYKNFEVYLKNLNYSDKTVKGYLTDLKFCHENKIITENLSIIDQIKLISLRRSPATIQRMACSIKKYNKYLIRTGKLFKNLIEDIDLPRIENKPISVLSQEEVIKLINKYRGNKEIYLVLNLLYSTGCRIESLSYLKVEDFKEDHIIFNVTKGNNPYTSILTNEVKEALKEYTNKKVGYLFINERGAKMTPDCLRKRLQRGLKRDYINPHFLRHCIATTLLNNGAELIDVSDFLNHKSIVTTQRYLHMSAAVKRQRLQKSHPMLTLKAH